MPSSNTTNTTDVVVVGGGLSGLHTARELNARGLSVRVLEARGRLGGRILSEAPAATGAASVDLGPAWFWPHQERIGALIADVGLTDEVFPQYAQGDALFEAAPSQIQHGISGISMAGSLRLNGGLGRLIDGVAGSVPTTSITTGARVQRIERADRNLLTTWKTDDGSDDVTSRYVVVALPPRLAVSTIEFTPPIAAGRRDELLNIATWMAAHAKAVFSFERPFWREAGLSGDVISRVGPLHEIHDASARDGHSYALFGFFGVPAAIRQQHEDELLDAATEQLVRLFGKAASEHTQRYVKDWAADPLTATELDQETLAAHSFDGVSDPLEPGWDGRLIWSGSETAGADERNTGYLEGALEASERSVQTVVAARSQ